MKGSAIVADHPRVVRRSAATAARSSPIAPAGDPPDDDLFRVELVGGHSIVARRVLAATGLIDELPDIEGLAEHWGGDVIHCPFCHGFEVRDRRIVQIVTHQMGLHTAGLFRQLTAQLTVVIHGTTGRGHLRARRSASQRGGRPARAGEPHRRRHRWHVTAVELADRERIDADAVAVGPRFRVRANRSPRSACNQWPHPSGLGDFVETDATGETTVPGLYAAGNVTDPSQQVLQAAAHGSRVGAMISFSLAHDDIRGRSATIGRRRRLGPSLRGRPDVER